MNTNDMNYKLTTLLALMSGAACANGAIALTENLSIEGFVDAAYSYTDSEFHLETGKVSESDNSYDVDQIEIDFLFNFGAVSARVDVQSEFLGDVEFEQAYFDYDFGNGGVISAGRYDSWLGFEAFEPTGQYQYSSAYNPELVAGYGIDEVFELFAEMGMYELGRLSNIFGAPVSRQANGVRYAHTLGQGWLGLSVQDGYLVEDGRLGGDSETDFNGEGSPSSYAFETAAGYTFSENLRAQVGGFLEKWDSTLFQMAAIDGTNWGANGHLVYEQGGLTVAGEFFFSSIGFDISEIGGDETAEITFETFGGMLMANYEFNGRNSVTGRLSYVDSEIESDFGFGHEHLHFGKYYKATAAYNHVVTENLRLVTEVSYVDGELAESDYHAVLGAVRALFSF